MYNIDDILTFGKHRGRSIYDIITGLSNQLNDKNIINNYVLELIDFLSNRTCDYNVRGTSFFYKGINDVIFNDEQYADVPYVVRIQNAINKFNNTIKVKDNIILFNRFSDDYSKSKEYINDAFNEDYDSDCILTRHNDYRDYKLQFPSRVSHRGLCVKQSTKQK